MHILFDGKNFDEMEQFVRKCYPDYKDVPLHELEDETTYKALPGEGEFSLLYRCYKAPTILFYNIWSGLYAVPGRFIEEAAHENVVKDIDDFWNEIGRKW